MGRDKALKRLIYYKHVKCFYANTQFNKIKSTLKTTNNGKRHGFIKHKRIQQTTRF